MFAIKYFLHSVLPITHLQHVT